MSQLNIPVFYGSYRSDRAGIRLANYTVARLEEKGHAGFLVDAKAIDLPMLDRMYKEFAPGEAPPAMEEVAGYLRNADAFAFVTGEYNWAIQPGLKNLMDHFLEEWFWRPAAILSYSAGRTAGARASYTLHPTLAEMGMVVVPSTVSVPSIKHTLDEDSKPIGDGGESLTRAMGRTIAMLEWWAEAANRQRGVAPHPA